MSTSFRKEFYDTCLRLLKKTSSVDAARLGILVQSRRDLTMAALLAKGFDCKKFVAYVPDIFASRERCIRDQIIHSLCTFGIECHIVPVDVSREDLARKRFIQSKVLSASMDAVAKKCWQMGVSVMFHGDTADDNVHSFLYRISKGTSLVGFCGIRDVNNSLLPVVTVRPFLGSTLDQVYGTADALGIPDMNPTIMDLLNHQKNAAIQYFRSRDDFNEFVTMMSHLNEYREYSSSKAIEIYKKFTVEFKNEGFVALVLNNDDLFTDELKKVVSLATAIGSCSDKPVKSIVEQSVDYIQSVMRNERPKKNVAGLVHLDRHSFPFLCSRVPSLIRHDSKVFAFFSHISFKTRDIDIPIDQAFQLDPQFIFKLSCTNPSITHCKFLVSQLERSHIKSFLANFPRHPLKKQLVALMLQMPYDILHRHYAFIEASTMIVHVPTLGICPVSGVFSIRCINNWDSFKVANSIE